MILLQTTLECTCFQVLHSLFLYHTFGFNVKYAILICIDITCSNRIQQQQQPFKGLFSRTTWVSQYQKGKSNLDFTGERESEWQWHQLGHMQVCTSLQTDNHASTPPLCFLQAGYPSCRPTNSVKALKASSNRIHAEQMREDSLISLYTV